MSRRKIVDAPRSGSCADGPTISSIESLGGRGSLYLLSLLQSHNQGQRLAPTRDASASVLAVLSALGIIHTETTAISNITNGGDALHWSYTWASEPYVGLEQRLFDFLTSEGRHARFSETWLRIWLELFHPELVSYLHRQLQTHKFGNHYSELLTPILASHAGHFALGHWRYACWAAVRSMASNALRHPGDDALLGSTLVEEIPRRLRMAKNAPGDGLCFWQSYSTPPYTLATALASVATELGDAVWKSVPRIELLP